jgi:hypothetical protein
MAFIPTLFVQTRARRPAIEAPMPSSRATFSLLDHSTYSPCRSARPASTSTVPELGDPG